MKYSLPALLLTILLVISACNDAPSDVGNSVLSDTVSGKTLSSNDFPLLPTATAWYDTTAPYIFNNGPLYVGVTSNSRAASMCRVYVTDTSKSWITVDRVDKVVMLIRPRSFMMNDGGSDRTLEFNVVEMTKSFMQDTTHPTVQWKDLFTTGITPNPAYFPSVATPMATYSGSLNYLTDTSGVQVADTTQDISLELNATGKQVVTSWLNRSHDTTAFLGFGLLPTPNCKVIQEFSTANNLLDSMPYVRFWIYYRNQSDQPDSTLIRSSNDVTFVNSDSLPAPLYLVQPVAQRGLRFIIDLDSISLSDAILKAEFSIAYDRTQTRLGNIGSNNVYAYVQPILKDNSVGLSSGFYGDTTTVPGRYTFSNIAPALDYCRRLSNFSGKATLTVQQPELGFPTRHAVYGLEATGDNKPRLTITTVARPTIGAHR